MSFSARLLAAVSVESDNELTLFTLEPKSDNSVRLNIERLSNMLARKLEDRKSIRVQTLVAQQLLCWLCSHFPGARFGFTL